MRRPARILHIRSKGQVGTTIAVSLAALVGVAALGTDVSVFYYHWSLLQKAADAAVLAGANFLPTNPDYARTTAHTYATQNGISGGEIIATNVAGDNLSIQIQVRRTVPYYFARVLGLTDAPVTVSARAGVLPVGKARGLVPIGIDYRTDMTPYVTIVLKKDSVGPGNWQPLALGAPGGDRFRENIQYGYDGVVAINDYVATETGQLVGPTGQGINDRIAAGNSSNPGATSTDHPLTDPRIIQVPIVDFTAINGKSQVPVLGFAVLWVMG
ncbi:MAG: hypothetical protein ACREQB_03390, partial [Candidatus Binataceae bacterium]